MGGRSNRTAGYAASAVANAHWGMRYERIWLRSQRQRQGLKRDGFEIPSHTSYVGIHAKTTSMLFLDIDIQVCTFLKLKVSDSFTDGVNLRTCANKILTIIQRQSSHVWLQSTASFMTPGSMAKSIEFKLGIYAVDLLCRTWQHVELPIGKLPSEFIRAFVWRRMEIGKVTRSKVSMYVWRDAVKRTRSSGGESN